MSMPMQFGQDPMQPKVRKIQFIPIGRPKFWLDVDDTSTISQLKEQIAVTQGKDDYPVESQRLCYIGKWLEDIQTVRQVNPCKPIVILVKKNKGPTGSHHHPPMDLAAEKADGDSAHEKQQEKSAMDFIAPKQSPGGRVHLAEQATQQEKLSNHRDLLKAAPKLDKQEGDADGDEADEKEKMQPIESKPTTGGTIENDETETAEKPEEKKANPEEDAKGTEQSGEDVKNHTEEEAGTSNDMPVWNDDEEIPEEYLTPVQIEIKEGQINAEPGAGMASRTAEADADGLFEDLNEEQERQILIENEKKRIKRNSASSDDKAVLICNKQAFEGNDGSITKGLASAELSQIAKNDQYLNGIQKCRRQSAFLIFETAEDYKNITLNFVNQSKHKENLKWVYNLLDKKSEEERIVFEDPDKHNGFILAPDRKWNGTNLDELYFLAVANRRDLRSVRDLTVDDLPLLENIRSQSVRVIYEKYGLKASQLKMYFHYQPTFYHLHVHIVHMNYEAPGLGFGCTSILLDTVIENLKIFPDYYAKATLPFIGKENDLLYMMFSDAERV